MVEKIKLVLFDMDNVLCDYDKRARAAFLAGLAGTTTDLVYEAIWEAGFEQLGDSGALDARNTYEPLASASAIRCRSKSG